MSKIIKLASTILLISLFLIACSSDEEEKQELVVGDVVNSAPTALEGTWVFPLTDANDGTSDYLLTFKGLSYNLSLIFENSLVLFDTKQEGSFQETGTKTVQPNNQVVSKIIVIPSGCSTFVTAKSQVIVDSYNANAVDGFTNWVLNVKKDVSLSQCDNSTYKDIYLISQNMLYLGDEESELGFDSDGYAEVLDIEGASRQ